MHETSLGRVVCDYLTGEEIEETSYEDCRQALAKLLVEERGYPRENLRPKVGINFLINGENYCRVADFVVYDDEGMPLFLIFYTAGQPGTFDREVVSAARLVEGGPAPLVTATNLREAVLHEVKTGAQIGRGPDEALPRWEHLQSLLQEHEAPQMTEQQLERERRILYTYSEFIYGSCCFSCPPKPTDS